MVVLGTLLKKESKRNTLKKKWMPYLHLCTLKVFICTFKHRKIHRHSLTYHFYYSCVFHQQNSKGHDLFALVEPFQQYLYHFLCPQSLALWLLPIKTRQNKTKTQLQKTYSFIGPSPCQWDDKQSLCLAHPLGCPGRS